MAVAHPQRDVVQESADAERHDERVNAEVERDRPVEEADKGACGKRDGDNVADRHAHARSGLRSAWNQMSIGSEWGPWIGVQKGL
jgi:hypothetical protein